MKNKTILLGILAIFIIVILFYGSFSSSFGFVEGLNTDPDPLDPETQNLITGFIQARISPDNPSGTLTDDNIIKNIQLLGSSNCQITKIMSSSISSKDAVDKFAILFGQSIYDALQDGLVIHYIFDEIKTKNGINVIQNKSKNNLGANPNTYDAVIHRGTNNPQPINTLIDNKNPVVNPSCLFLDGLPRSDPLTNGSNDNGAYLMIPTLPTFYDSTGFLGMSFSLWGCATEKAGGNWTRYFDFANGAGSDNILMSPSHGGSTCLNCFIINASGDNRRYDGDYVCDSNWRHLVWTISKSGAWTVYINGRVVSNNIKLLPPSVIRKLNYIGKSNWNEKVNWPNDDMYNGWIDDFRMYQRELSSVDVNALYSKGGRVQQKDNQFWVLPDSQNKWYNNNQGGRNMGKIKDLGILSNYRMTIAFWLNIESTSPAWRNIFLITNNGDDNSRVPALYIYPGQTRLHFRFATKDSWNWGTGPNAEDPTDILTLGKDTHIAFTINNSTIKFYVNGVEKLSGTLPSYKRYVNNTSATSLHMAKYHNCENVRLKNFQLFNRTLLPEEVKTVYSQVVCQY